MAQKLKFPQTIACKAEHFPVLSTVLLKTPFQHHSSFGKANPTASPASTTNLLSRLITVAYGGPLDNDKQSEDITAAKLCMCRCCCNDLKFLVAECTYEYFLFRHDGITYLVAVTGYHSSSSPSSFSVLR